MDKSCAYCGAAASTRCGKCKMTYYCNVDHQVKHWKLHGDNCNITLAINEKLGRHFIASKPISNDDIIYQEYNPLLIYSLAFNEIDNTGLLYSSDLNFQDIWHNISELKKDQLKYARFSSLQFKVGNLDTTFGQALKSKVDCEISEQELSEIHSRIRYNSVNYTDEYNRSYVTIFGSFSFFSHSCMRNATYNFVKSDDKLKVQVKAVRPIAKGDVVNISYIPLLATTYRRQRELSLYGFACDCARCEDITEFGTNFGAVKCFQCSNYMYFDITKMSYKCNDIECSCTMIAKDLEYGVNILQDKLKESLKEVGNLNEKANALMQWLKGMETVVHPNHALLFQRRFELLQICSSNLSVEEWKAFPSMMVAHKDICANLLNIVTKLNPLAADKIQELERMLKFFSDGIE